MTPSAFIAKWQHNHLSERAGAQAYFLDLCDLVGVDKPNDPENYCFERGATRTGAGHGWADVWKRNCFAWENKAPGKDLSAALKQLMSYALALDNPPLLVVCDRQLIQIHTHFTGAPSETHTIRLEDIGTPENFEKLRWLFNAPDRFRPTRTTLAVTAEAASRVGALAIRLSERGEDPLATAHFLIQCVFCMFAEDAGLLPDKLFETVLDKSNPDSGKARSRLAQLFEAMQAGGDFALENIAWFNGGLFKNVAVPPLTTADVEDLLGAARMNWRDIEPAILGTLFERGLNPDMRSQLGAHYTDPATIDKLIEPVITRPLKRQWSDIRDKIEALAPNFGYTGRGHSKKPNAARREADGLFLGFLETLKRYRVLDPACGSGNFLYLALKALKNLEHRANLDAEALGLHRQVSIEVCPENVMGIELNAYAAELARVTVWIGEIQWMLMHGYPIRRDPILAPLDHIECRDAVLVFDDGGDPNAGALVGESEWPTCDAIVGNPPFLGDKVMRSEMGDDYVSALRTEYQGRVPGGADLVTYWFEKARAHLADGKCKAAGLVATNSIRGGANRRVLDRITESGRIFEAWGDEPWVNEGAAVRVSLVCFDNGTALRSPLLDGMAVETIHADLTAATGLDLTAARPLSENANTSYLGIQKTGPFDIPGELGRRWLGQPNPNGKPNSVVVKPWFNGLDVTRRNRDMWIIDFGIDMSEEDASLYELPFAYAKEHVKPARVGNRDADTGATWWLFHRPRPAMREATKRLSRFIVTPEVSKHRVFAWMTPPMVPDKNLTVIARADDATFGVLQSRFHELWALRLGTSLEDRPRYTPSTCFETFPFPTGITPRDTIPRAGDASAPCMAGEIAIENVAAAARRLNELREAWLNPPEWVDWTRAPEEELAGFPKRPVAKLGHEAALKKRTLTNLYNTPPAWLTLAHQALDRAVATAYGWSDYTPEMSEEDVLRRLLAVNLLRTGRA